MDTRKTLQVVLIVFVASSVAQNFQPLSDGGQSFQPQRVGSQGLTQEQRDALRVQDELFHRDSVLKAKRPPNLEQPVIRSSIQQPPQVQQSFVPTQFQSVPQPQPQTRTQTPVRQQPRPAVRQQQPRQPVRPQPQAFEPPEVTRQQLEQLQVPKQFDQTTHTAQQVNEHFFPQLPQQDVQQSQEPVPVVVRRPAQAVVRTQPQQTQQVHQQTQQPHQLSQLELDLLQHQAENARYSFAAAVTDTINDQENVREETRDGLNLRGLYSYSDGYFKRTVHYEADQNGYRVVKEEVDAIGDGPRVDPNGRAEVSSNVEGNNLQYSITSADIISGRTPQSQQQNEHGTSPFVTGNRGS